MALITGERNQISFLPPSIEDYVGLDDPVRAYDAFVDHIDITSLGLDADVDRVGAPEFDPVVMLKLLVYGYSYGLRSSRKLERATHHNLSFIWLTGGLRPDHKTIARFRRDNKDALKKVLKQCARLCAKLGLMAGNTLFIDGTKMKANASLEKTWTDKRCQDALKKVDTRIEEILAECEATDEAEANEGSLTKMKEELKNANVLKAKIQEIVKELHETQKTSFNTTDPDCNKVKGRQGVQAGYNMQSVVDDQNGLVVSTDVVSDNNDLNQFSSQVNQANETLATSCQTACADAGYANTDELKIIDDQQIQVVVPSQKQATEAALGPFDKAKFTYDSANDCYVCPEGQSLSYRSTNQEKNTKKYLAARPAACRVCRHFGVCTTSPQGRGITRLVNEEVKERLEAQFDRPECQAIFKRRKARAEHPFGHLKWNLGVKHFLLRGLNGVKAEASLLFTGFNLKRTISILGVHGLIQAMETT